MGHGYAFIAAGDDTKEIRLRLVSGVSDTGDSDCVWPRQSDTEFLKIHLECTHTGKGSEPKVRN